MYRTLAIAAVVLCAWEGRTMETRLEVRNGVPVMLVAGKPMAPMMFWGGRAGRPVVVGTEWQNVQYSFVAHRDDPDATLHVHLALATGTVWLDQVELLERDGPEAEAANVFGGGDFDAGKQALEQYWNFFIGYGARAEWAIDDRVAHSGTASLRVTVAKRGKRDWHVHVYTKRSPLRAGKHYTASFWVRADRDKWPVSTCVMRLNPYLVHATGGGDSFSETARIMSAHGFHIYTTGMGLPWPKGGERADYKGIDAQMAKLVADDPQALLLPRIGVEPPGGWAKEHPDEMLQWENGKTSRWVCVASEPWRRDAARAIAGLVQHLEANWSQHVLGYHPAAQNSAEWYYPIWYNQQWGLMNFSPAFARGFRAWLRARYRSVDALNAAWRARYAQFGDVPLPSAQERRASTLGVFRDPARERHMIDFTTYQQVAMVEALDHMARAIKDACGGRKLVYAFYGYTAELAGCRYGIGATGHLRLGWLLRRPGVDVVCAPSSYFDRHAGGSGPIMGMTESVNCHGKVWLNEDDTRTHLSRLDAGFGRTANERETLWVHRRNFMAALVHRSQMWFMDQGAGWLAADAIWANLARLRPLYDRLHQAPSPFRSDVAVIVHEDSLIPLAYGTHVQRPLLYEMRAELNRMGTTYERWLLSDFIEGNVPSARLYFFLNAFWLTPAQRRAIRERFRHSGATAVWFYAPGFLSDRASTETMRELTGFGFRQLPGKMSTRMRIAPNQSRYTAGLAEGEVVGPDAVVEPVFAVEREAGVTVLACYERGSDAAMAVRQTNGHTSLFVGALKAPARMLAAIAGAAGVHLYCRAGDVVHVDGRTLSLTACDAGRKTVTLPRPAALRDVCTGETLSQAQTFHLDMRRGETRVFEVLTP